MNLLLIEDEQKIADFVCEGLIAKNFRVTHCNNGLTGFEFASRNHYDLLILDIMLPGRDGLDILSALRQAGNKTPIILLTARNELGDRVKGLDMGADDYLAKPFYVEELIARINALLRRQEDHLPQRVQLGCMQLDQLNRSLHCDDQCVQLTSREFSLLEHLMRSPNQVVTRGQLLEHVWGYDFNPCTNVVDACVKRVRRKISELNQAGRVTSSIESVRGTGYKLSIE